jgi:hypothetical protein
MGLSTRPLSILAAGAIFARLSCGDVIYVPNMVDTGPIQDLAAEHPSLQETIGFTLSNTQAYKVDVDSIADPRFTFYEGPDQLDTISNLSRTGGNCGAGTVLNPKGQAGSTCTYEISFLMSDSRDFHDPDDDYGVWLVTARVFAHKDGDPNTVVGSPDLHVAGTIFDAHVASLDKGVPSPLPEPASMLLIGSGMFALGLYGRRRV